MGYFWAGLGAAFGTVLGILVGFVLHLVGEWRGKLKKVTILKREFNLNIKRIDELLQELVKYRSRIDADDDYFGYLNLSQFLWNTAQNLFYSGLIYDYLKDDKDINKLQTMFLNLSPTLSNYVNQVVIKKGKDRNKKEALGQLDYYEKQLRDFKNDLDGILKKLPN